MATDVAASVPNTHDPLDLPTPDDHPLATRRRRLLERATLREVLMGAQDNLTTVLAVALGVTIGSGQVQLVALAGLAAGVAESVSMGGVLYSATRAEQGLELRERARTGPTAEPTSSSERLSPIQSGFTTFTASLVAGLIPLVPFIVLPLPASLVASVVLSVSALFVLGSLTGRLNGQTWWRDGIRLVTVAGLAALAAAFVGAALRLE